MRERTLEILLVEDDEDLAVMIERHLADCLPAGVTRVSTAAEALREELTTRHDLLVASMDLPDEDVLRLAQRVRRTNRCPIILLGGAPDASEVIDAMRLGVSDVLVKPFELSELSGTVRTALHQTRRLRKQRVRHRRLRKLVARIICERRDLSQRMDLLCRDFVQAHRRLAEKVAQSGMLTPQ
ncbi:MAG: hypothetical protein AMXMBFR13_44680 [Phycisphaerae bacterium]|jgi:DNA-binding response OmpR family regulator